MGVTRKECPSCGIWTGGEEEGGLVEYRGIRICFWCIKLWKQKEELAGRKVSFEQLIGKKKITKRN